MQFIPRLFNEPDESFFLFGPRGVGKSTLMRANHEEKTLWIDLLQPDVLRSYYSYPERLESIIKGNPKKSTVVVDEIQKAPELLPVVHRIIEEKRGIKFILTGSSARKLKKTSANLLGGRALKRVLHPFVASELGEDFSLKKALEDGLIPLVQNSTNPQDKLQAYVALYLQEEIQSEGLIRQLENFSRFLEVISFSHASLLNISNVARECEVKRKTVENYIGILEDLLLAYHLPVFTRRAQRELSVHPKFYLFDAGVFQTLRPKGPLDKLDEMNGAALEGLVAHHLKTWNDYSLQKHQLAFWRTRSGVEVDFVVYGPTGFWAIEVKNTQRIFSQDIKSLDSFLQDYPIAQGILLYRGTERLKIKNVLCLPCEEFLLQLKPDQKLWIEK